jgi:hypothetical protein
MEVYALMRNDGLSFQDALNRKFRWTPTVLEREAKAVIGE